MRRLAAGALLTALAAGAPPAAALPDPVRVVLVAPRVQVLTSGCAGQIATTGYATWTASGSGGGWGTISGGIRAAWQGCDRDDWTVTATVEDLTPGHSPHTSFESATGNPAMASEAIDVAAGPGDEWTLVTVTLEAESGSERFCVRDTWLVTSGGPAQTGTEWCPEG